MSDPRWFPVCVHTVPADHPEHGQEGRFFWTIYQDDEIDPGGVPVEMTKENVRAMAAAREMHEMIGHLLTLTCRILNDEASDNEALAILQDAGRLYEKASGSP